jgi:hypothetical protein
MFSKKILFLIILSLLLFRPVFSMDVSLKFSGGLSLMSFDNVNRVLQEWVRYYQIQSEKKISITYLEGEIPDLKTAVDLEGELAFKIIPWLTLSLGTGLIHAAMPQEKTTLLVERPAGTTNYIHPIQISVIPATVSAYFSFKIFEKLKAYIRGGGGLAWLKYVERSAQKNITRNQNFKWLTFSKSTSHAPIFIGGLGVHYQIEPGINLFVEGLARNVKFTDIAGLNIDDETGTLFHLEQYSEDLDHWLEKFQTYTEEPSGDIYRNIQKARIDFSGFSIKIGLMIRF